MTIKDVKLIELPRFMDPRGNLSDGIRQLVS